MSTAQDEKISALESQVEKLQSQKDVLIKELDQVEERSEKLNHLYQKYFPVIIDTIVTGDDAFSKVCTELSKVLKKEVSIGKLEYIFEQLKTAMLKEDIGDPDGKQKKGLFGAFKKPAAPPFISVYRQSYIDVLDRLRSHLDKQYSARLDSIATKISDAKDADDFSEIRENVFKLIFKYISDTAKDRDKINVFIREIVEKIFDIELVIHSGFEYTDSIFQSNQAFELALNMEIAGLRQKKEQQLDIDNLKVQVDQGLAAIEKAIQKKRAEDNVIKTDSDRDQDTFKQQFSKLKKELDKATQHTKILEKQLNKDQLTGSYNRRAYDQKIEQEMERFLRYGNIFSLLIMDVDKFKRINDDYGHAVGDKCLQEIIKRTLPLLRINDTLARYGGEEFAVIMPETEKEGARAVAEKIRQTIEKIAFLYKSKKVSVTISIGVSQVSKGDKKSSQVFERADIALYQAKEQGRNQVVVN